MAGEDRILKILLLLQADTAGAQQTTTALKEVETQAAATNTTAAKIEGATGGAVNVAGLLGGAFAVAGVAAFGLYGYIEDQVAAQRALNEETLRQNEAIDRSVTAMIRLADKSKDIGDQIRIGDKVEGDLIRLSDKMRELRIREIDSFSTWGQTIESIIRKALVFTDLTGAAGAFISPQTIEQQKAAAELKATQEAIKREILDTNAAINIAVDSTKLWNAVSGNLSKGIALFNQELADAQAKLATLDAARRANPDDRGALENYNRQKDVVADLTNKVDLLTGAQARLAVQSQRVADAISHANFEQMDPAHKLGSLQDDLLQIQVKLRDVGVLAASPNEALAKASDLIKDDAKQTEAARAEVIRLAGAWAQVLAMMLNVGTQERAAQEALAKTIADTKLLNDEASGNTAAIA